MNNNTVIVLLQEEYGYRWWLWKPGMSELGLIDFWENLESLTPYFMNPSDGLPGSFENLGYDRFHSLEKYTKGMWSGHIHDEDDSWIIKPGSKIKNRTIFHKGHPRRKKDNE